jgi:predicted helicase
VEGKLGQEYREDLEPARPRGRASKKARKKFGPEDVLHYIYAVFHSPSYRERYGEFLKMDFPRVPLTSDAELFWELCGMGSRLVGLHLLENSPPLITSYPVSGSDEVDRVRYVDVEERVYINAEQYFGGVPKAVWDFHVGGYRVCEKWLKDRKGRKLSLDDINHYQKVVAALSETMKIMAEIDAAIASRGGFPLK